MLGVDYGVIYHKYGGRFILRHGLGIAVTGFIGSLIVYKIADPLAGLDEEVVKAKRDYHDAFVKERPERVAAAIKDAQN